jgi:hypothetical protein
MIEVATARNRRKGGGLEEDELLNLTSGIDDLVRNLQKVENVLDVAGRRAREMRSEADVSGGELRRQ